MRGALKIWWKQGGDQSYVRSVNTRRAWQSYFAFRSASFKSNFRLLKYCRSNFKYNFTILGQETGPDSHGKSWEGKAKSHIFTCLSLVRVILTIWEPGTSLSKLCEILCIPVNGRFENAKLLTQYRSIGANHLTFDGGYGWFRKSILQPDFERKKILHRNACPTMALYVRGKILSPVVLKKEFLRKPNHP